MTQSGYTLPKISSQKEKEFEMPDLITHTFLGYAVKRLSSRKTFLPIFVVGACLPDLFTRVPVMVIVLFCKWTRKEEPHLLLASIGIFHEPVGYFLLCSWICLFIPKKNRRMILYNLLGGGLLHYFLDLLQSHITPAYMPLFPFSKTYFEFGCMSTEASLFFIPLWIFLGFIWWWNDKRRTKNFK